MTSKQMNEIVGKLTREETIILAQVVIDQLTEEEQHRIIDYMIIGNNLDIEDIAARHLDDDADDSKS